MIKHQEFDQIPFSEVMISSSSSIRTQMALCLVIDRDTGTWNLDNVMTNYCNQDFDLEQDTGIWPVIVTQDRLQEPESRTANQEHGQLSWPRIAFRNRNRRLPTGTWPIVVAQDRIHEQEASVTTNRLHHLHYSLHYHPSKHNPHP